MNYEGCPGTRAEWLSLSWSKFTRMSLDGTRMENERPSWTTVWLWLLSASSRILSLELDLTSWMTPLWRNCGHVGVGTGLNWLCQVTMDVSCRPSSFGSSQLNHLLQTADGTRLPLTVAISGMLALPGKGGENGDREDNEQLIAAVTESLPPSGATAQAWPAVGWSFFPGSAVLG